jgi:hypothetical protein
MLKKLGTTSSNKTSNYALSQWELADRPQMEDFNYDNEQIDKALDRLEQGQKGLETKLLGLDTAIARKSNRFHASAEYISSQLVNEFKLTVSENLPESYTLIFSAPADWGEKDSLILNGKRLGVRAIGTGGATPLDRAFSQGDIVVLEVIYGSMAFLHAALQPTRVRAWVEYGSGVFWLSFNEKPTANYTLNFIAPADWKDSDTLTINRADIKLIGRQGNKPQSGAFLTGDFVSIEVENDTAFLLTGCQCNK